MKEARNSKDIFSHTLLELRVLIKDFHHARIRKDFGFTYNESLLMKELLETPYLRPGDLAKTMGSEKSTISRQIAVLEKKGYVQRAEDPASRRSYRLHLTDLGIDALRSSDQLWAEILEKRLSKWSQQERENFLYLLTKYNRTPS